MRLTNILEVGEVGPLPLVGFGLLAVALPWFVPSLRPELGGIVKASAKLFLEAELGADNHLTDWLVDSSVDALLNMMPKATKEQHRQHTEREIDRFFSRARAASHRRGFDRQDGSRRYQKHLSKMERALISRQKDAGTSQRHALEHGLRKIADERRRGVADNAKSALA
jgi:hypothetical protein